MYISGHPALLYIIILYSIYFLYKAKTRNEFILIFTLFMFFIERNSWENGITSLTLTPIRTQPTDIALLLMVVFIIHQKISKTRNSPLFFKNDIVRLFFGFVFVSVFMGGVKFGYASIAEFRSVFYYIIIMIYISTNVRKREVLELIKGLSTYLMPLIILAPLNLVLTNNYSLSVANRQFGALTYETITLGFLSGLLYYQFIDKSYRLPLFLLPIFVIMIPYTSHRTVWAILFATVPIIFLWVQNYKYMFLVAVVGFIVGFFIQIDIAFIQQRLTAFTDFDADATGSWRMLIWNAVIDNATFMGNGLGARFIVHAKLIGDQAMAGAHNGFIQTLYYLGYLGISLVILFVSSFLYKSYIKIRMKNIDPNDKFVYRLSFLSTIALIMYMIGYGADVVSWIFISFSLILNFSTNKRISNVRKIS